MAHMHRQPRALRVVALARRGLDVATSSAREFKCVMRRRIATASARRARNLSNSPQPRTHESGGLFTRAPDLRWVGSAQRLRRELGRFYGERRPG